MHGNSLTNQWSGNSGNSMEYDQKLIRLEETSWPTEFDVNLVSSLAANVQRNCLANQRPTNDKFNEVRPKVNQSGEAYNELAKRIWAQSDKWFVCKRPETNQSEARKQRAFSRARAKVNQVCEVLKWIYSPSLRSILWAVWKCAEIAWPIRGQEAAGIQQGIYVNQPWEVPK